MDLYPSSIPCSIGTRLQREVWRARLSSKHREHSRHILHGLFEFIFCSGKTASFSPQRPPTIQCCGGFRGMIRFGRPTSLACSRRLTSLRFLPMFAPHRTAEPIFHLRVQDWAPIDGFGHSVVPFVWEGGRGRRGTRARRTELVRKVGGSTPEMPSDVGKQYQDRKHCNINTWNISHKHNATNNWIELPNDMMDSTEESCNCYIHGDDVEA